MEVCKQVIYAVMITQDYPDLEAGKRYEVSEIGCLHIHIVGNNRRYDKKSFVFYKNDKLITKKRAYMEMAVRKVE